MPTNLRPRSETSAVILPSTGTLLQVTGTLPFGIYTGSAGFISGATDQVSYVYKKLGGDVVDIELTVGNVYAAYEEAVLEYSYIINLHQGKNVLSDALGNTTGTFDHKGDIQSGPSGSNLRFPKFKLAYGNRVADGLTTMAGLGGTAPGYSGSFTVVKDNQDYDVQAIVQDASTSGVDDVGNPVAYAGKVEDHRIIIDKVFYRSPIAMWRFYGYYGGIGVVGNSSTYGQFADDSTFEVIPTWQNKMQAIMYEDSLYTRVSHYSYEIINNKLRLYPNPSSERFFAGDLRRIWFKFRIDTDAWSTDNTYKDGTDGVNNLNTLPFDNVPYKNINAIGKQWIRKYALALCKEMLGQIRGKFTSIPIPGDAITLNHADLLSQAKDEQEALKTKLSEMLEQTEYKELVKGDQEKVAAVEETLRRSPLPIFVG